MKKLRTLSAVGLLILITACGPTQTSTTNSTNAQVPSRGRSNAEITSGRNTTSASRTTSAGRVTTATRTANIDAGEEERMQKQKMYSDLEMSQEQRERFEREWENKRDSWKRSNLNKTMNRFERSENQQQILKDILTEQQFQQYQMWAKENAGTKD